MKSNLERNQRQESVAQAMKLVHLNFSSPFRIGKGENYIDAITIYRAFIKAYSLLGYDISEIVHDAKVKFSSLFPMNKGRLILRSPIRTVICNDRRIEKMIKGASLIDFEVLKSAELPLTISCDENQGIRVEGVRDQVQVIHGVISASGGVHIRSFQTTQFNAFIDRSTNSAVPFSITSFFLEDGGILVSGWNRRVESALALLSETGFGGKRSIGFGKFKIIKVEEFQNFRLRMRDPSQEWKYLTGRGFATGEFIAERLDKVNGISGDVNPVPLPVMGLLPAGSLLRESERVVKWIARDNVLVIDPITLG
jgi:CRISPR type III-A-associated RAMP protein Csm4